MSTNLFIVAVVAIGLLILVALVARSFNSYNFRAKIVVGILAATGLVAGILVLFTITRSGQIISTLSGRLETSVRLLAEEQLVNTAFTEAGRANQYFEEVETEIASLAQHRAALQGQQSTLGQGAYWDAASKLVQLDGGQYGNPANDVSSVFVPANQRLDVTVLAELNTSAYLDFSVPQLLEGNSAILAIYYVDSRGLVRYYPNIELASLLPADFDATARPYYQIASPLFNPQRLPNWTIPYVDAAGGGLVVTVVSPVYYRERFSGIMAADIQLSNITEQVAAVKLGQTGYAFILDEAGRIVSMPEAGYALFGINPDELPADEFFKQTVFDAGSEELKVITRRMTAGGNGINIVQINGVDTYISYSPIRANGYSLALVIPVSEMQGAIIVARNEIQAQIQSAIRTAVLVLLILLLGAVLISLVVGQVIAAPVVRLTEVASQITQGDLSVRSTSTTRDEIGTLAGSFNTMTARLLQTLGGLEKTVEERTAELVAANQRNERRARQFEAIAQVTRTISSTRDLENILEQIPEVIHRDFGFYHIGIFLLDTAREYAVLSASNSEGGKTMLANGHRLKVGETGIVGFVTGTGRPRVALNTGTDAIFFNNAELPETRSEIALPLRVGEEVIGALDVQSTEPNAFDEQDVRVLGTLADQVSIAIQNARQYERTRAALAESDALSRQFIQTGWSQFTKSQRLEGIRHTGAKSTLLYRKPGKAEDRSRSNTSQLRPRGRGAVLSLPIKLRGEVIGTVDVRSPENRQWDPDEMDIVAAILERAAIAMENARLLADSQKLAAKERTIGEISARISAQSEIEELLKTAVQELGRTLPGTRIAIQLNKDHETDHV